VRGLAFALVWLVAAPAAAYRTSEDSAANQASGITGRIAYEPLPVPFAIYRGTDDVPLDALHAATVTAFESWTEPACSALTVRDDGTSAPPRVWGDDQNTLEWVETGWASRGPAFGSFTIAVTTNQLLRVGDRWTIDESDMELNAEGYRWVIDGGEPDADPVDVQGLVVHEAGHFLGLLHPCESPGFDGAPDCPAEWAETPTMAPVYTGEEQRTLAPDDVDGICYLYPAAATPDAGPPDLDAGAADAGPAGATDGGAGFDAGVPADAGAPPADDGGCACRATLPSRTWPPALAIAGLAQLARRRR